MPRLFVAIDPPESLRAELSRLGRDLAGSRATPPEQLHLTLRFIGEVDEATGEQLSEALGTVQAAGFDLTPRGVGFFPNARRPRIAWAGFERSELLEALQAAVETAIRRCGLAPETEAFRPHVTLARIRRPDPRAARAWLAAHHEFDAPAFAVEEVSLYSSELRPTGALHRRVARCRLATN